MSTTLTASGSLIRSNQFTRNIYRQFALTSRDAHKVFESSIDLTQSPAPLYPLAVATQAATTINFLYIEVIGGTATIRLTKEGAYTGNPSVLEVSNEIPIGVIDGSNNVFTLEHAPIENTEKIYVNGNRKLSGVGDDYLISSNSIVFNAGSIPPVSATIVVDYFYNPTANPIPLNQQDLDINVSGTMVMSGIDINQIYIMGTPSNGCYVNIIGTGY